MSLQHDFNMIKKASSYTTEPNLPHVELHISNKGGVFILIPHRQSKHSNIKLFYIMYACRMYVRESMGGIEGLRGADRGRDEGGNRIKVSLVQIGAFDSRFCTRAQVAVHSGPLHRSLGVRRAAEQQPTCQLI